ncbi:MAG: cell wall hydrolase [Xanthobacteraceae bacterium]
MPTAVGYQDFAALLAERPVAAQRSHEHLLASPFGTIEPATFSYGIRPIGTTMPPPPAIELVNFDPRGVDAEARLITASLPDQPPQRVDSPTIDRRLKGDRLAIAHAAAVAAEPRTIAQAQAIVAAPAAQPAPAAAPAPNALAQSHPAKVPVATVSAAQANAVPPSKAAPPKQIVAVATTPQLAAAAPAQSVAAAARSNAQRADGNPFAAVQTKAPAASEVASSGGAQVPLGPLAFADDDAAGAGTKVYFDSSAMDSPNGLHQWEPGAAPTMVSAGDPATKIASVAGPGGDAPATAIATGKDESRLESPAQRLGLAGQARAKAEKCLTEAVYFEARGESLRGQEAVAQVVMNRVFSGYYPSDVCGVVFQNANHYLACQFTFACEGRNLNRIEEPDMWEQAEHIAKDTLDGKIWLADIGHATHYHASWVHPSWVHEMTRLYRLGVHTFYRPRAWGNGDYEPVWGTPPDTSAADPKAVSPAKGPQAEAAPAPAAATKDSTAKL